MQDLDKLVRQILAAGDGEIVGRIRFQKIAYLLEQKGLGADLGFTYHHYGPFCRDLGEALDFKVCRREVEEDRITTGSGAAYSILRLKEAGGDVQCVGQLPMEQARHLVTRLKRQQSVVLELAATAHWLQYGERVGDWRKELKVRKSLKATDANIDRAIAVLKDIGLPCEA